MKLANEMLCPVCEAGKLGEAEKDIEFTYKGEVSTVRNARVFVCDLCNEALMDDRHARSIERSLTDLRRKKDGLLTSGEIRSIRSIFNLSQVEFAKKLGVGEKNFARYESGQAAQSRTMDNLLRILRDYPQAIASIRYIEPSISREEITVSVPVRTKMIKKPSQCGDQVCV